MGMFVWLVVAHNMKGEWSCVSMENGEECALTDIILMIMLKLCADSWDFHYYVRATNLNWDHSFETVIIIVIAGLHSGFRDVVMN